MRTNAATARTTTPPPLAPELLALTVRRLDELDRLKDLAYDRLGMIGRATAVISMEQNIKAMLGPTSAGLEFNQLLRSVRQIMVLEFELRGLFKAPDRDGPRKLRLVKSDRVGFVPPVRDVPAVELGSLEDLLDIRTDYRRGPMDEIVGDIRKLVRTEAPLDDPFAPSTKKAPPKGPEYYMRTKPAEPAPPPAHSAQTQSDVAMKAATMTIRNLSGKGFRQPSKAKIKKHQRSRGPPK